MAEHRGVLRIDSKPGAKKFQGVWLEVKGTDRWVIDYRARGLWTSFADREVIVTGDRYTPPREAQAIEAVHLNVDSLRVATVQPGLGPYVSIGPERDMRGKFVSNTAPAGSKLSGAAIPTFIAEDGVLYGVLGDSLELRRGPIRLRARELEADMSYAARSSNSDLWIVDIER